MNLIGSYNYGLVALSVVIAMVASYAALDLAARVTAAAGWTRAVWLLGGAGAMGMGIWSMHYIGMLAFVLPIPVAYHWPTVLLSLFAAILASVIALHVVSRQKMSVSRAVAGSVLMGVGIASMHYIGMAAMRLPAISQFNSLLVVLSVLLAVLISLGALSIAFQFRNEKTGIGWEKLAGAVVMGAAIPVMHYTGMAAASFTPSGIPLDSSHAVSISTLGTAGIVAVTFIVLGMALLTSAVDRRFAAQTLEVQEKKLQQSEAYLSEAQRLSHTGSFGWRVSTGEMIWSEETFRIFQYDRAVKPGVEQVLQRVHPVDAALVRQTIERASQDGNDFDFEHRLLMPGGVIKHVRVVGHPLPRDESGELEFVGAITDITDRKHAEEALRRSETYLAEAQRLSHTGSWACNITTGEMIYSSEEHHRLFGLDPAMEGIPSFEEFYRRIHPEDRDRTSDNLERAIRAGTNVEEHFRVVLPEGTTRYMYGIGHPALKPSGDTDEFLGIVMDVTERKLAQALLAGEKRLLEMVARGDSLANILDSLCRLVEEQAGDVFASILLLDSNSKQLWHGGAPSLPKGYNDAINGLVIGPSVGSCGTAAYLCKQVIVSDIANDPLWSDFRELALAHSLRACWSTPIFSAEGNVIGTFAMYYREPRSPSQRDQEIITQITHLAGVAIQRKLAEDALRRSEAYLAETQRLTHTGSWAFNATTALYWSEENFRLWGLDPQQGLPDRATVLQRIHPEDRGRVLESVQNALREGTDYSVEFRIVLPDGTVREVHGLGHPVLNANGELVEVVGTQVDVTERKRAEQEREKLHQLQADLARINRVSTMGELTASLAHEVNQPITAAVTDANACVRWLTRDSPDVEEARAAASRIVQDAMRAADIVSRIRLLFQKSTPPRELVDLNEVIREMVVLLRSEATRYSISIRVELPAVPPFVMGDRVQLQQVMMNLMMNATDAMKDVEGMRELAIKSQPADNDECLVSVSDTGVGLPAQQADQIFNAFFTTKPRGTGMGLSISRSIVESHGGRLWAGRNAPRGASFYFTLPSKAQVPDKPTVPA